MDAEVVVPVRRLDLEGACEINNRLWTLPPARVYTIDFGPLEWVEPFGMLLLSRQLRRFSDARQPSRCVARNHEKHGYAAHMGFFQSFGLRFGNEPGSAPGSIQYVPLTAYRIAEIEHEASELGVDAREAIERRCNGLATILARSTAGPVHETLTYSLREIFRNVLEHSRADSIWYAAQCWPDKETVELSILDEGVGVRASLCRNPELMIANDEDALRLAVLPGISGVRRGVRSRMRDDAWVNSGFGLYMTSHLCMNGGTFLIASGECGYLLGINGQRIFPLKCYGTILRLEIFLPRVQHIEQALREFREQAAVERRAECDGESRVSASMQSRLSNTRCT